MKRLALVLAVVAIGACAKAEQQSAQQSQMADTSHNMMMMSDTSQHMMADTSKKMAPAPAKRP